MASTNDLQELMEWFMDRLNDALNAIDACVLCTAIRYMEFVGFTSVVIKFKGQCSDIKLASTVEGIGKILEHYNPELTVMAERTSSHLFDTKMTVKFITSRKMSPEKIFSMQADALDIFPSRCLSYDYQEKTHIVTLNMTSIDRLDDLLQKVNVHERLHMIIGCLIGITTTEPMYMHTIGEFHNQSNIMTPHMIAFADQQSTM